MYAMSCFLLPKGVCRDIEQMMNDFLWGNKVDKKNLHWMSWTRPSCSNENGGLGFRNNEAFNLAFLAKQGWRLIHEPDSLVGKLFKARYLPRTDFLCAKEGFAPSYTWKSICKAKEVIDLGSYWQVGNGLNINVWIDRWIPRPVSFKVLGNFSGADQNLLVSDLIDWEHSCWREEIIQDLFSPQDVELITSIHLLESHVQDQLVWFHSNDGNLTVKSAYHVVMVAEERRSNKGAQADNSRMRQIWKWVWSRDVCPRMKNMLWIACLDVLPCKANLVRKKVVADALCWRCGRFEDIKQCLWDCVLPRQVWKCFPHISWTCPVFGSFLDWVECLIQLEDKADQNIWVCVIYYLWRARNLGIFEGQETDPAELINKSIHSIEEYNRACQLNVGQAPCATVECGWQKPPVGWIKVNCDASVRGKDFGIGILGRDAEGRVVLAGVKKIQSGTVVDLAEAKAIRWGILAAHEACFARIIIESDSKKVVRLLSGGSLPRTTFGQLIAMTVELSYKLDMCRWRYAKRNENRAANWLSKGLPLSPVLMFDNFSFHVGFYELLLNDSELVE